MKLDTIKYLFLRFICRLTGLRKKLWPYLKMERLAMMGFSAYEDVDSFRAHLHTMLGDYSNNLLDGLSFGEKTIIIESAEQALRHEFDLLGSGIVKSDPIDWQTDLKSGKRWKKQYYLKIDHLNGADIKMPWELSRCQHLLWLGEAYLLTNDERFAQEVIDEINWWIDDNPLMYTVNWTCAMDVAFRAVNWLFSLNMISGYEGFDDTFANKIMRSLWQHGFYIRNNLEKVIPDSNNHYTSDLVGLLYIGELYRWSHKGNRWRHLAQKELISEIRSQVLPLGVHYEKSVSYHRMMTEMLSYPAYLLLRCGESFPKDVLERLQGMYDYVSNYVKPNGFAPLIADNDDGRFVPFLKRDFRYHEYLNDPQSIENRFVAAGMQPLFCTKQKGTKCYSDAGVAIIREGNNYLFINNGGYSKRPKETDSVIGTHTHNDLLSFELALNGKDIIVDPGTYLYTSSKKDRDDFRATAKHNTVAVDGEEQNAFASTFSLKRNVKVGVLKPVDDGIDGEYRTIKGQMKHHRRFELMKNAVVIRDQLEKKGSNHDAKFYFHFAQGIVPTIEDNKVTINDSNVNILFNLEPNYLKIIDDTLSPSFGILEKSKTLVVSFLFDNELDLRTKISCNL